MTNFQAHVIIELLFIKSHQNTFAIFLCFIKCVDTILKKVTVIDIFDTW